MYSERGSAVTWTRLFYPPIGSRFTLTYGRTVVTKHVNPETPTERVYEDLSSSDWFHTAYQTASTAHDKLKARKPENEALDFTLIAIGLESGWLQCNVSNQDFRCFTRDIVHRQHKNMPPCVRRLR